MNRRSFTKSVLSGSGFLILNNSPQMRRKPIYLKAGDTVGLICPAGIINEERITKATANMKSLGLEVKFGDHIMEQSGYLAGTDANRIADIHRMYRDPSVQAIWCIRGGYGCTRLLPMIDFELLKSNPKPLFGYSDITAFHHSLYNKSGIQTFHSPVGASDFTPFTFDHLKPIVLGESGKEIEIKACAENDQFFAEGKSVYERYVIHPGKAEGSLWGGNLSLLAAMLGTDYLQIKKDTILYIEDVGEAPYRIDRMLTQLFQAVPLNKIKGIVVGVCDGCEKKENDQSFTLKEVIEDRIGSLKIPAVYGFPFGHISNQCTFPFGAKAIFDADAFMMKVELP